MKNVYIKNKDDVIIICDDKTVLYEKYRPNIASILAQENLIEKINYYINLLEEKKEKIKKNKESSTVIILPFIFNLLGNEISLVYDLSAMAMDKEGQLNGGPKPISGNLGYFYKEYIDVLTSNALEDIVMFLKDLLNEETNKLEKMKNDDTCVNNEIDSVGIKVNDKELIENLKRKIIVYIDYKDNEKKYLRYYEKGNLEEKLKKRRYTDEDIDVLKKYLNKKDK